MDYLLQMVLFAFLLIVIILLVLLILLLLEEIKRKNEDPCRLYAKLCANEF